MKINKLNVLGILLLFIATIAWGSSFVILKETISKVPTFYVLAIRFTLSGILMGAICFKKIIKIPLKTIIAGVVLGVILALAYDVQTFGLAKTSPARNAFLTSSYCIMTPFMVWLISKKRPKFYNLLAAFLCLFGIGLVVFSNQTDSGSMLIGDLLTLVSAIFYALQIVFIDKYHDNGHDGMQLLVIELLTVGFINIILFLIFDLPQGASVLLLTKEQFIKIMYLMLVCTLFAQFAMIFGQSVTTANQASLILSLEAVFGALFSVILGAERFTIGLVIGFIVIFIAMSINEFHLDPMKLLKKKIEKNKN